MTKPNTKNKLDAGKVLIEELTNPASEKAGGRRSFQIIIIPLLAVFSGLVVGALIIVINLRSCLCRFSAINWLRLSDSLEFCIYSLLRSFPWCFWNPRSFCRSISNHGPKCNTPSLYSLPGEFDAFHSLYPCRSGVALGFRAGVFNIGAEGQVFIGALAGTYVGYSVTGLPAFIHLPLTLLAGFAGGALWGFIPGWLKAKTGGHEVINTIMMNYIAF